MIFFLLYRDKLVKLFCCFLLYMRVKILCFPRYVFHERRFPPASAYEIKVILMYEKYLLWTYNDNNDQLQSCNKVFGNFSGEWEGTRKLNKTKCQCWHICSNGTIESTAVIYEKKYFINNWCIFVWLIKHFALSS